MIRIGMLLLLSLALVFTWRQFLASEPVVVILTIEEATSSRLRLLVDHWLWRLKPGIPPARRRIIASARVVEIKQRSILTALESKAAYSDTNGLRVWLLTPEQMTEARIRGNSSNLDKVINIVTDDGFQATTFTGGTCSIGGVIRDVGLTFTCRPYIRRDEVMLISTLTLTELVSPAIADAVDRPPNDSMVVANNAVADSVRTNIAVASKIRVPRDREVLLLKTKPGDTNRTVIGLMISLTVQ